MAKLNDKQKKKIIAERVEGATIRALADKYKVSPSTIQNVIKGDEKTVQKCTQKKDENSKEIFTYMDKNKDKACSIIGKILNELDDEQRIKSTPLNQLATTMGILIDKFSTTELSKGPSKEGNNLAEAIANSVKALGEDK